jgi:hypothetical protein
LQTIFANVVDRVTTSKHLSYKTLTA